MRHIIKLSSLLLFVIPAEAGMTFFETGISFFNKMGDEPDLFNCSESKKRFFI